MSANEDYILRERRPVETLVPALDGSLELSEKQIKFLLLAIRDMNPEAVDSEAEIRRRILEVQSKAYQTYPYPCIRAFQHVALFMSEHDVFAHVLKVGQSAAQGNAPLLLDIGCCMGTDLRYLVQSGYPSDSVIGCDVRRDFIDLGYELYGDRDTCPIPFLPADIFDLLPRSFPAQADEVCPSLKDVQCLNELRGRVKYVYAGALFHLFDEGTQEAIARRLVTLLDVIEGSGPAVLFGRSVAKAEEGVIDDAMGRTRYGHSPTSWAKLWTRVLGDEVRVRVDTEFPRVEQVRDWKGWVWNPGRGTDMMWWSVWVLPWLLDQLAGCQSHGGLEPLRSNCKDSASLARSESPTSSVRSSTTRRFMRSASSSSTVETLPNISPYYGLVHIDHEICASAVPSQSECQHGSPSTSSVARLKTRHPLLDHLHLQPCS